MTQTHLLTHTTGTVSWVNDIELTYYIKLMPESTKTLEQASDDMITGVTIGTIQTSEGTYTPKVRCLFGPHPGAYKGEVTDVQMTGETASIVKVAFSHDVAHTEYTGFAGLFPLPQEMVWALHMKCAPFA